MTEPAQNLDTPASRILALWDAKHDTREIARRLLMPEHEVANWLWRLREARRAQ